MATIKAYVDLTSGEENVANKIKSTCREIVKLIETINTEDNIANELIVTLESLSSKISSLQPFVGGINNLKSSIQSQI